MLEIGDFFLHFAVTTTKINLFFFLIFYTILVLFVRSIACFMHVLCIFWLVELEVGWQDEE